MPVIYIDNKPYEAKAGKNLLEAALGLGFDLPYFCWHPALGSVGACRQCAVKVFRDEQDTKGRIVMSCMEGVRDGLRLSIEDPAAKGFREQVIEWLMTNHPHDCPVCDEGGSCHLQDMTVMAGHDYRRYTYKKRTYNNQYLGPLIHHEMNRCIQCYRCVRYYKDYAGGNDLNVFAAHNHVYFGREKDGILQSPFSGNLVEVCPTGVFTDKTLKEHYTRKWDLTMAPSVCQHCSLGCNIIGGERYGELRCVMNHYNGEVNGYFLCDRGRFGYEFVNSENRISTPIIRNRTGEAADEEDLWKHLQKALAGCALIGIGSPRASLESNFALMQLVGKENFYQGITENEAMPERKVIDVFASGNITSASLHTIEQSDAVLILGEDIWNTAPIMAMAVRQAVRQTAADEAIKTTPLPQWHDAAISDLVQDRKGFLANITVAGSPVDEIATTKIRATPDDIARIGFAIAAELNASLPPVQGLTSSHLEKVKTIASALRNAKRPVIISGTSNRNEALVRAASNIAVAAKASLSFALQECNSMGLAMMQAPPFEAALTRMKRGDAVAAIVLENDLYRHVPATMVNQLIDQCKQVIALDSLHNATTEKAHVVIPVSTFAEADGTLVNNEGRAQRFFQVFMPTNKFLKESWRWLTNMKLALQQKTNGSAHRPDEILKSLEKELPQFNGVSDAAPSHDFSIHGERIPRAPHRYSGRTAMLANIKVSEPKPLQDDDSPLSFTMEGFRGLPPSDMIPFFWSPGWNSVQSVTKYQDEPGGSLKGGDPGIRLFRQKQGVDSTYFKDIPEAFAQRPGKWQLLPQYHVLGSGELSSYTKALQELSPQPTIAVSANDAGLLGVANGDKLRIVLEEKQYDLPLQIRNDMCDGIALVSAGLPGVGAMNWLGWAEIKKV